MDPHFIIDDKANARTGNVEQFADLSLCKATTPKRPDFFSILTSKFMGVARNDVPSLFNHIVNIIQVGPKEHVARAHASSVVAMVANKQAIGNAALAQFPRKPVRPNLFPFYAYFPIACLKELAVPFPAPVRFFYLIPKSFHGAPFIKGDF